MSSFQVVFVIALCGCYSSLASRVAEDFERAGIVPDILDVPPTDPLGISFPSGVTVRYGNQLTPTQVHDKPTLDWDADPRKFYSLLMVDPDTTSRENPNYRSIKHWNVINIPGKNVNSGNEIAEFFGSAPSNGTGYHRYTFLMYEQPYGRIQYDGPIIPSNSIVGRTNFNVMEFARNLTLCEPSFGNFYLAMYDESVPASLAALGVSP